MISKNLFWASMVENNKRRVWVWIVSMLFWFFYYPVIMAMLMSRAKGYYMADKMTEDMFYTGLREVSGELLRANGFVIAFVTLLAIICAIHGFSYLYSKKKVDLYHSVPVSKSRRFFVIYINGILIFFIPFLLNMILAMLVAGVNGGMCADNVRTAIISAIMSLILYAGTYGLSIIAVMLTGNVVITLFAVVIFLFYEIAVRALLMVYQEEFFEYFSYRSYEFSSYLSPAWQHFKGVEAAGDYIAGKGSSLAVVQSVLICVLLAVFFGFIGYLCYRKRPSEAAGKSIAFPATKAVIKVLITVPFTLYVGSVVRAIMYTGTERNDTPIILFLMAAAAIISSCMIEVIYELDIRAALRKKCQILITGVCAGVIYCIFQFDLTGFDRWTPDKDRLDDAVVMTQNYMRNYIDENLDYQESVEYYLSKPGITDIDSICELSEKRLAKEDMEERASFLWFDVAYRMKSGKIIWRSFPVSMEEEEVLNKIIGSQELKNAAYQIYDDAIFDAMEKKAALQITYNTGIGVESLSPDDVDIIRQLYIKDLNEADYSTFKNEYICGVLEFSIVANITENNYTTWYFEYDIYPSYTNTIDYLKEKGVYREISSMWENVQSLTATNYHYEKDTNNMDTYYKDWSITKTFSDEQQIKELSAALYPSMFNTGWMPKERIDSNYYIDVQLNNERRGLGNYRASGGFYLIADKVPEWLEKETAYE